MRRQFWKEYGSKLFALFIILMMITVVYPVLITNAKNPSQLSAYDDDWNDISQFANDIDQEGDGKHEIKTIVSRPAIINKIAEVEKNSTNSILDNSSSNLDKKITSDNAQLSPGKKRMLEFLKKNSK